LPKVLAKLLRIFRLVPEQFPCPPKKISRGITYTMLSNIFIFVKTLKLQFLPKFSILWKTFRKIQSLGLKFLQNFFVKTLKLQFLPKFSILWKTCGKIQSLGLKFLQNFPRNIDKNLGATTLCIMCI